MKQLFCILIYIVLGFTVSPLQAETLYVTDRILLGVHQQASEQSPLITSIASGTAITVIERGDDFTKVRLNDGTQGWVSSNYLKKDKPASAQLDASQAQLQKAEETSKKLSESLSKVEREVQTRRDEASNYKTTIKELRKQLADKKADAGQPIVDDTALKEAQAQIKSLQQQLAKLEQEKTEAQPQEQPAAPTETDLAKLQADNQQMQVRIEAALANLKGEQVPTAAELAAIRPSFPVWYWILLIALFVAGIAIGVGWIDYSLRKKHGGFRI